MRLQRLTGLEQDKIISEYREVMAQIADLLDILATPARVTAIIVDELAALKQEFGRPSSAHGAARSSTTRIDLGTEDLITPTDMVVTLSHSGYMKASRSPSTARSGAAAAASRRRRPRKTTSSSSCSSPTRTTTSCASRSAAACTGSRSTKCRRARATRAASRSSTCSRCSRARRSPRPAGDRRISQLPGRSLRLHGDGAGRGQEDQPRRLLATRARPASSPSIWTRRLPDRRRAHRRQARRDAVQRRRQGGALRRERRAPDGPRRARRARHDAGRRRRASSRCWSPRTKRRAC